MSKELKDLKEKLEAMNIDEVNEFMDEHYGFCASGLNAEPKDEAINKIIRHEATKPKNTYRHKTMSESYYGQVTDIKDIGDFVDEAISQFKKSNITPLSKIIIEIDEDLGELVFVRGYNIKVINVDLQNEFKIGDTNG